MFFLGYELVIPHLTLNNSYIRAPRERVKKKSDSTETKIDDLSGNFLG